MAAVVVVAHFVMDTALRLSLFTVHADNKRRKELVAMGSWLRLCGKGSYEVP